MKLLIATIALWAWNACGQTIIHYPDSVKYDPIDVIDSSDSFSCVCDCTPEDIYDFVDQEPEYPGGVSEMLKFIMDNFKFPQSTTESICATGRIYVQFVINENGCISQVQTIRGLSDDLDKEAERVISSMPRWKPGVHNGRVVKTRFILPIHIRW